ncbi:MAG TPA: hypothetical protein VN887_17590, partial [Candidatus Angelobacter sp.]|nr:hypothetical protein [Candidatus Angelobacter sp.]
MSNHPGLRQTLELLDRLKSTVRESAARAERLAQESSASTSRLDWQTDKEIKELEAQLVTAIAGLDARLQPQKEKLESAHDWRHTRLQRAQTAARKHHLKTIESGEGRQINEVQRELLQTSRNQETEQKQADRDFADFQETLTGERESVAALARGTRNAFRGYAAFRCLLDSPPPAPGNDPVSDANRLLEEFRARFAQAKRRLFWFRLVPPVLLFSLLPPRVLASLLVIAHGAAVPALPRLGGRAITWEQAGLSLAACLGGVIALHFLGRLLAGHGARTLAGSINRARALLDACQTASEAHYQRESERIRSTAETKTAELNQRWNYATVDAETRRNDLQRHLDAKLARAISTNDRILQQGVERLQRERNEQAGRLKKQTEAERARLEESCTAKKRQFESSQQSQWQTLEADWNGTTRSIYDAFGAARESAAQLFPEWHSPFWTNWTAPREFLQAAPFARLEVDLEQLSGALPRDPRLKLPGPPRFSLPLLLTFPDQGSILFETRGPGRDRAIAALNNLVLRLLSGAPPGRAIFTILDPSDLGQSFAGFMHLTDHEDRLINRRIWTQPEHIEQRLAELNEHIEKVTQLYLRNEFATIAEYNEQAGRIAEPYHFLVVADFPVNFSDAAIRRLLSIIASGPRCGVFTLIHWDPRKGAVSDFVPEDLRKTSVCLRSENGGFVLTDKPLPGTSLELEPPPAPDVVTAFLQKVGRCSVDSNRVEMPFAEIAPDDSELWTV